MSEVNGYNSPYDSDIDEENFNNITDHINNGNINADTVKAYLNEFNINPTVIDSLINKKFWNKTNDRKKYDKDYNKKYYEQRKEKNQTIICPICNGRYNKYSQLVHEQTKRHLFLRNKSLV
jgi:hypothetical protein